LEEKEEVYTAVYYPKKEAPRPSVQAFALSQEEPNETHYKKETDPKSPPAGLDRAAERMESSRNYFFKKGLSTGRKLGGV